MQLSVIPFSFLRKCRHQESRRHIGANLLLQKVRHNKMSFIQKAMVARSSVQRGGGIGLGQKSVRQLHLTQVGNAAATQTRDSYDSKHGEKSDPTPNSCNVQGHAAVSVEAREATVLFVVEKHANEQAINRMRNSQVQRCVQPSISGSCLDILWRKATLLPSLLDCRVS